MDCWQSHAQLLYRATRDGFEAKDFWQRCAGKGPTLTIAKVGFHKCIDVQWMAFSSSLWLRPTHRDFRTVLPLSLCAQVAGNDFICGAYTPVI